MSATIPQSIIDILRSDVPEPPPLGAWWWHSSSLNKHDGSWRTGSPPNDHRCLLGLRPKADRLSIDALDFGGGCTDGSVATAITAFDRIPNDREALRSFLAVIWPDRYPAQEVAP